MGIRARVPRVLTIAFAYVALTSALVGCGGKDYNGNSATNRPITTAFIRVTNTISDSPVLLAGLDGTTLTRVPFAQATGLQQVPSGKYNLDVQYLDANGGAVAVINKETLNLTINDQDTVYLLGTLATLHTKLVENPAPAITAGNAEVQVLQGSAKAGVVDVYLTDAAADLASASKLTSVAFEDVSPLATVPSGNNYRLRVTQAGTTTVLYDSGVFTLPDLNRVTFVVVDYFGPGGNGFRVMYQDAQVARLFPNEVLPGALRVANMISDRPSVDVYLGAPSGTPAFPAVAYGAISPLQDVVAGTLTYNITPTGNAATVIGTGTVSMTTGDTRTLVATRGASGVAARVTVDPTRPISGQGQFTVVQAAPTAGAVDAFFIPAGATLDATVATIVNQPPLALASAVRPPGTADVEFTRTGDKTAPLAGPSTLDIVDGGIYSVYLIDAAGGGAPYQIVFGSD